MIFLISLNDTIIRYMFQAKNQMYFFYFNYLKVLYKYLRGVSGNFRAKIVQKINFCVFAYKYSLAHHGKDSVSIILKKKF